MILVNFGHYGPFETLRRVPQGPRPLTLEFFIFYSKISSKCDQSLVFGSVCLEFIKETRLTTQK